MLITFGMVVNLNDQFKKKDEKIFKKMTESQLDKIEF